MKEVKKNQQVKYRGFPCTVKRIVDDEQCEIESAYDPKIVAIKELIEAKIYILCAAIHYKDGKKYLHQPKNIESGYVLCGRRHHNCITTAAMFGTKVKEKVQGFITSDDRFLNREESAEVARLAGQTDKEGSLVSEDLY